MNKRLLILAVVLTAQVALAATTLAVDRARAPQPLEPLFGELEVAEVTRLEIAESGDDARHVVLAKRGDSWIVQSHGDYPAKADAIEGFVGKLAGLKSRGPIATSAARHDRLGVGDEDFDRKVILARGDATETIYLGRGEGSSTTNLRLAGADETHGVSRVSPWEADPGVGRWIDTSFVSVKVNEVVSFAVRNAQGEFSVTRKGDETWVLADGSEVKSDDLTPILRAAAQVDLAEPVGREPSAEYGLEGPDAIDVHLSTNEGTTTYSIGAQVGEFRFVKAADRPFVVKVRASSLDGLVSANAASIRASAVDSGS